MPPTHPWEVSEESMLFSAGYRKVHQAAGMLTVRSNCSIDEAMTRLRRQAAAERLPIEQVAQRVIKQRISSESL